MNENLDPTGVTLSKVEKELENVLRPGRFESFAGQPKVVENLKIFVQAARERGDALDHVLLHGPPGLGKTTLSHIISNELGVNIITSSGPVLDKPGDLAGLLTTLKKMMCCSSMRFTGSAPWWKSIFIRPWKISGLTL